MTRRNARKRTEYERRVREVLTAILNDLEVMPNADAPDLVVTVGVVRFGRSVREIHAQVGARFRDARLARGARERWFPAGRHAELLHDVLEYPWLTEPIEDELARRLGLGYRPRLRPLYPGWPVERGPW